MSDVLASLIRVRAKMDLHPRDQLLAAIETKLEDMGRDPTIPVYAMDAARDAIKDLNEIENEADVLRVVASWVERTDHMIPGPERNFMSQVGTLLLRTKI